MYICHKFNSNTTQKERLAFIDYIRVVACFLVMMVHVTENFYIPDTSGVGENMIRIADDSNRFWIAFWNGGIARICVALFMIVSAFLLVPMKEGVGMAQFYKKRFLRIFPPMLFFMVLYSILPAIWGDFSWEQSWKFLKGIPLNFPEYAYHLWFMYPLISLYLFIPIISPWLEKASAKDERIFLFIFALSTLMPFIHKLTPYTYIFGECWWNGFHMFWYFSGYIGYLVMAHYIHKHIDWSTSKRMLIGSTCFVIGSAYTFGSHFSMTSADTPLSLPLIEYAWEFCTPNILLASFGAFILFTCIKQAKAPRLITDISKLSFGMYLMHVFLVGPITQYIIHGNPAEPLAPVWIAIPVASSLCYVSCYAICKIVSFSPFSKYLIG
jgi:surface polysaccharide O-acyltransferase-like enzyme